MGEGVKAPKEKRSVLQTVSTVLGVVLCVIFIPIVIINVVMIVRSYTDPDHIPSVFGISPIIVLSGSMSPEFEEGEMILIQKTDPYKLQVGDVVCYKEEDSAITHRIIEIQEEGGIPYYVTQGDANNAEDPTPIKPDQVQGKYMGIHIPRLGDFATFLSTVPGMLIFIGGPIVLFILWDVLRRILEQRRDSGAEKQLLEEREAMERELEQLRAQVKGTEPETVTLPPETPEGPEGPQQ